ncbi:MAG: phage tail protein I [Selenomonadaceae bacterium]|nr:phage tail protein I [Selenomonadaceae bacterium]MBR4695741.1 phage tail protein I [Selenomonadaceae bacterium]
MRQIDDYSIHEDLPESLNRKNVKELASLSDEALRQYGSLIHKVLIYPVIDTLPSELVNALAVQLHCDFYDTRLPLDTRRQLVKTSIAWHRIKGTPAAIEMLLRTLFHDAHVSEWFEYGGRPYFFRVEVDISDSDEDAGIDSIAQVKKAIALGKNVRSWLDLLEFRQIIQEEMDIEESRLWCIHVVNGTREDYPWRGRYFDTSWTFTDMPRFDGLWLYDGQYHFDGIPAGAEDEKSSRFCFDGAWWFGGDRCFGRPVSRKILWGTAEPDELAVVPVTSIQERYLVELPFDVLTPFDTGWAFGARDGPQDARFDAGVAPALKEILEVLDHSDEAVTIVRAVLRDVYPLAHLLHFDGTWAFQPMLSFNGSWRLEQDPGYRYGGSRFEPWRNQPASFFGEQKCITETFYEEAALCFDGGWAFETAKVKYFGEKLHFDGSWSLGFTGERNFGEIIRLPHTTTIEAEYEGPRYDGSWKFFGLHSADAFWDEDAQERLSVLDSPVEAEILPVEEGIGWQTEAAFADTLLRVPVYDGTWGFHEVPVLGECPLLFEALPAFGSGIAFDGAWAFDRCRRAFDGTWNMGDCRLHFDGAWHFDGETFFASHDLKEEAGESIRPVLAESICRSFGSGIAFDGSWVFAAEYGMGEGLAVFITEAPRFDGLWAFDDEARKMDGTWSLGMDDYAFGDKASPRNTYDGSWKFTDPMNTRVRFERRWRSFGSITFAA